jgi:hypothetical protein
MVAKGVKIVIVVLLIGIIIVGGYLAYTMVVPNALSVVLSPSSETLPSGQSVAFEAKASGGRPPYSYEWAVNGSIVSGVSSSDYTASIGVGQTIVVAVLVIDSINDTATVRSTIQCHPGGYYVAIYATATAVSVGTDVEFTSSVGGGTPPYTYSWYDTEYTLPLYSGPHSYLFYNFTSVGTFTFWLVVTDWTNSTVTSNPITVTVS